MHAYVCMKFGIAKRLASGVWQNTYKEQLKKRGIAFTHLFLSLLIVSHDCV